MKRATFAIALLLTLRSTAAPAAEWDASAFSYDRDRRPLVEASTPTPRQVSWHGRPPVLDISPGDLKPAPAEARPRVVGPASVLHLKFADADGEVVPALLCTPIGKKGPFPVVVAVHGLASNKAQVVAQLAPELVKHGFAVLAFDLPLHGERPGQPHSILDRSQPLKSIARFQQAIRDVRMCIDVAETRPELDTSDGIVLMGYSLGSWVNAVAGPADERVKVMVLMVGGAHDLPVAMMALPQTRLLDPRNAIAHFAPRPLLLLNATNDRIVTPDMGKRLFAACDEKSSEQRWYDCGHLLVDKAYQDAAEWVRTVVSREPGRQKKAS